MPRKQTKKKKTTRQKVDKLAEAISKAVGAEKLTKYVGESIARRKYPEIKRTVSGKEALKSGGALAANIASLAAGGAAASTLKAASKARKVAKAKAAAKTKKSDDFIKRTYSGHERAAMQAAARRNKARRKKKKK